MSHPFFDAPRYPWHRAEARELKRVLAIAVPNLDRIQYYYQSSADDLPPLTLPASADTRWQEALGNLAAAGVLRRLCELVRDAGPRVAAAVTAVLHAEAAVQVRVGPDDSGLVILDRDRLRQGITRLTPANTPLKAIVVRGDSRSGKTHGRYLFDLAAIEQQAVSVYLSEGQVSTVGEVLDELFGALDAIDQIPAGGDTTDPAYHKAVWRTLRIVAARRNTPLWIAIDDLGPAPDGRPLVDDHVRLFFDQLVPRLANPQYRQWFRLMLIHYPKGAFPTQWVKDVWIEESTTAADITAEHVADLFRAWSLRHGRTVVDEEIQRLATDIVARAEQPPADADGANPPCRLARLHDLVAEALHPLVEARP